MATKKTSDYSDRELLERSALFAMKTAHNTGFIKYFIIIATSLWIGSILIALRLFG